MSDLTTYFGNKIVRWLAGETMPSAPAAIYIALYNGDPKGAGTEVTTTINAAGRQEMTVVSPAVGVVNTLSNDAIVDFGESIGDTPLSYVAVFDASSSGNMLATKELSGGPFAITIGTPVNFEIGALTFTIGD